MNSDEPIPDRFLPPEPRPGNGAAVVRWAVTLIALVVLVSVAYKAYFWLKDDLVQRGAASAEPGSVAVPPPVEVQEPASPADAQTAASGAVSAAVAALGNIGDPDQRRSACGYLAAESARLAHDFKQPLPPPVIDRIATETAQLRAQSNHYGCAPGNVPDNAPDSSLTPAADD